MEGPVPAYQGDDPFVFVSYAHDDAEVVFRDLLHLHDSDFNIWYDDGIHPGSYWPEAITEKISSCTLFLYFGSQSATNSKHCQRELHFAVEADKPVIAVQIDNEPITSSVRFVLGRQQAIMRAELQPSTYLERLTTSLAELVPVIKTDEEPLQRFNSRNLLTVAVTPFEVQGDGPMLKDLADTLTQEMPMHLRFDDFTVVSTRSVKRAFANDDDPIALGRALNAHWVVYGALRKRGDDLEVRVELTDTQTGESLWSGRLSIPLEGADQYINYISRQFEISITANVYSRIASETADHEESKLDVPALQARFRNRTEGFNDAAFSIPLVERMIELEPDNPRPKANLVQVLSVQIANRGMGAADRRFARMKDQINEVMTLQRSDAPAIHACSFAYLWAGEQRLALQLARRAYSLAQVIATKGNLASCLVMNGLAKEAWQEIAELDSWYPPLAAKPHTAVFRDYYMLTEEWENALEWAERVHGGGPEFLNRMIEAIILAELDRIDAAKTKIDQVRSIFPRLNLRKSVASRALTCNNIPQFYHGLEILIDHGIE